MTCSALSLLPIVCSTACHNRQRYAFIPPRQYPRMKLATLNEECRRILEPRDLQSGACVRDPASAWRATTNHARAILPQGCSICGIYCHIVSNDTRYDRFRRDGNSMRCSRSSFPYLEYSRKVLHEVLRQSGLMTPIMNITTALRYHDSGGIIPPSSGSHVKLRPLIASSAPIGVRINGCADDAGRCLMAIPTKN